MSEPKTNKLLNYSTVISTVGDYFALFCFFQIVYNQSNNIALASSVLLFQKIAKLSADIVFTRINKLVPLKITLLLSHAVPGLIAFFTAVNLQLSDSPNLVIIFASLTVFEFFSALFDYCRETYTKLNESTNTHLKTQGGIMSSLFLAQIIGPILAFIFISTYSYHLCLYLNSFSFLLAFILTLFIPNEARKVENLNKKYRFKDCLNLLKKNKQYRSIFLLNSFGTIVYSAIYNYLVFSVINEHFGKNPIYTAWIYAIAGLGSLIGVKYLKTFVETKKINPTKTIILMILINVVSRYIFVSTSHLYIGLITVLISGIPNGAISTLFRFFNKLVYKDEDFALMYAAQNSIKKVVSLIITKICVLLLVTNKSFHYYGFIFACIWGLLIVIYLLKFKINIKPPQHQTQ